MCYHLNIEVKIDFLLASVPQKSMPAIGALLGLLLLSGAASAAVPSSAAAPVAPVVTPTYAVTMTAYNAVPWQTDEDPFTTASGAYSNPEIIAARSRDFATELPFGTVISVEGPAIDNGKCGFNTVKTHIGYRIIADTMHEKFTNRIDLLFATDDNFIAGDGTVKNASVILGKCDEVVIRVVGHLDGKHPGTWPKTQIALAELIEGGPTVAVK